jgi:hypothetical protein
MKQLILFFITGVLLFAQSEQLYMSQPVMKAYENGTRTYTGKPGDNYWMNRAEYKIKADVDPQTKTLRGEMTVRYFNNSPDTLKEIVMHLYPDIFKKGSARDWSIPKDAVNDGVVIEGILIKDNYYDVSDTSATVKRVATNMTIVLDESLDPNSELAIDVKWNFVIPFIVPVRTGAYSDTSMFIAYWYPKIAVYDDIHGWDDIAYKGTAEMYSSNASFDVEITTPKNYIVWATGVFENAEEVLDAKYFERYNEALNSEEIVNIITEEDLHKDITKGNNSTWKFNAETSPDFAFALGKNYLWDASTVKLKDKTVFVDAGYKKESKNFREVVNILKEGVKFYSEEMPGITFPYPTISVFNGNGGMEFPMILNDGEAGTHASTVGLTLHELAHTYMPFYMGTNERRYAFMDEGWAVFAPVKLQKELGDVEPMRRRFERQEKQLEEIVEVPPMTPSFLLNGSHYRVASYTRSAAALFALQSLLGEELFLKAMQTFMNEWNGKHPTPYDFFFTFNRVAEEDLTWFWKPWYFEFHSPDLNIKDYKNTNGKKIVTIENMGGLPMPVKLKVYFADNSEKIIELSPRVWENGETELAVDLETDKEILEIELGDELIPDINYSTRETINGD